MTTAHPKAGRLDFLAVISEPQSDGYPDTVKSRVWRSRSAAQKWSGQQLKARSEATADIYERRWEANEFDDRKYGRVLDAEAVEITTQYGWRTHDGTVHWDPPQDATP